MSRPSPSHNVIVQIKVKLLGVSKPPVWRRLQLRADTRLDQMHEMLQAALGWEAVRRRMAELSAYTRRVIRLPQATPELPGTYGAMTAFELPPGTDPVALRKRLWDARIEIPVIDRPDRLLIRVSHHFYTTEAEIDRLAAVLREVL